MQTHDQVMAERAARLAETAEQYALCRNLAVLCWWHGGRYGTWNRQSRYWRYQFGKAYVAGAERAISVAEVDAALELAAQKYTGRDS